MDFKDVLPIIKNLIAVQNKDKRFSSTKNRNYRYVLSCIEKGKFETSEISMINNEDIIQEFSFFEPKNCEEGDTNCNVCKFAFTNISIGSTHIRDLHDLDLSVIQKLAVLELLTRSNLGTSLCKDVQQTYNGPKNVDLQKILENNKDYTVMTLKIPYFLAMIVNNIRTQGLDVEGIFRKSVSKLTLKTLYGDLIKLVSADDNNILRVRDLLLPVEPEMLAAVLKVFLRQIGLIIPTNVVKLLMGVPDVEEPEKTVLYYQCLMLQVAEPKRSLLEVVINLLSELVENEEKNKMNLYNAAALFAPVIFRFGDLRDNKQAIRVLQQMIHYGPLIFLVPRGVINIYMADSDINGTSVAPFPSIGKKTDNHVHDTSVVLCNFTKCLETGGHHDCVDSPRTQKNVISFKYKKQTKSFEYDDKATVADLLKTADGSGDSSQLRLVESCGHVCKVTYHPQTSIENVVGDSGPGLYSVVPGVETDIVKSAMKELSNVPGFLL